ncbi:hypothetical protein Asp14428_36050 [Actinoplanes sp. NBRC 14428]|nr:hypothetical protein Asp14428_36050 [Actinoplanes sp. NBRC 14428]
MPGRGRSPADGGDPPGHSSRPRGAPTPASIHEAHETTAAEAQAGRATRASHPNPLITPNTGHPGGTPDGRPTRIDPHQRAEARRSLERENSAAEILANRGYQIRQNPTPDEVAQARRDAGDAGRSTADPDYLLEGRVFDCYSPKERTSVRNVWSAVEAKVQDGQTQRVVVNLQDWRGDLSALHQQFASWPVENLKEVKAITADGDIIQLIPRPRTIENHHHGA